jgi:hypothetical protein
MIMGLEYLVFVGRVLLVIAALISASFPVLYMRVKWYKTVLGRAIMIQALALALALWNSVVRIFFLQNTARVVVLGANVFFLFLIVIATAMLAFVQWRFLRDRKRDSDASPSNL